MKPNRVGQWFISVLIALSAGSAGTVFNDPAARQWYEQIRKPEFTPPDWAFGPVWTLLYLLIGTAAFLVYKSPSGHGNKKSALIVYGIQLLLNFTWTILFFGRRMPGIAFIEILLLFIFICMTAILFWPLSKKAALLFVPYILWVGLASALNFEIFRLNR